MSKWAIVESSEDEMVKLIESVQANGFVSVPFNGEEVLRLFAYRRMIQQGLFTDEVQVS